MRTYFRILSYADALWGMAVLYLIATILSVSFGLINLSLLIPLLEVLFSQQTGSPTTVPAAPAFAMSLTYLKNLFSHHFVASIAVHGTVSALYFVCSVMVLSVLLANLFRYLSEMAAAELRIRVVHNLRQNLFERASRLPTSYFNSQRRGDVMARVMGDVQEVEYTLEHSFRAFVKDPITIVGFFGVLFYLSPQLTWFALLSLPVVGGGITGIVRRLLKRAVQSQVSLGRLMHILEETMTGMCTLQAFNARGYVLKKFAIENKAYARLNLSIFLKTSLIPLLSEFLGVLVMTSLLAYGGKLILLGRTHLTASSFITYIIMFSQTLVPIKTASRSLSTLQRGLAAAKRIFALNDVIPSSSTQTPAIHVKTLSQSIQCRDVSLRMGRKSILRNLNMTIKVGQKTALVGPSGGGKSTIVGLIARVLEPTRGAVLVDNVPAQHCSLSSLRKLISIASQDAIVFHDTVFNNIALGRAGASQKEVRLAAQTAQAEDFIAALPQGYDTIIGEGGLKLSSGQRQQLGIARAILTRPEVLILDEATAAMDNALASRVQASVSRFMEGKTVVWVAHQLNTIRDAAEIFVIDAGRVVEHGTHNVLMHQEGLYKRLNMLHYYNTESALQHFGA